MSFVCPWSMKEKNSHGFLYSMKRRRYQGCQQHLPFLSPGHSASPHHLVARWLQDSVDGDGWEQAISASCLLAPPLGNSLSSSFFVSSHVLTRASLAAQMVKNLPALQETWVQSWDWEDPLEKGMTTHSSFLDKKIPWTEELGRLQSMGLQRVGHNWGTNTFSFNSSRPTSIPCPTLPLHYLVPLPHLPSTGPTSSPALSFHDKKTGILLHGISSYCVVWLKHFWDRTGATSEMTSELL